MICLVNSVNERDLSLFNSIKHDSHFRTLQRDFVSNALKLEAITGKLTASAQMHFSECPPASELMMPNVRFFPAAPEIIWTSVRDVRSHPIELKRCPSDPRISANVRSSGICFFLTTDIGEEKEEKCGLLEGSYGGEDKRLDSVHFPAKYSPSIRLCWHCVLSQNTRV